MWLRIVKCLTSIQCDCCPRNTHVSGFIFEIEEAARIAIQTLVPAHNRIVLADRDKRQANCAGAATEICLESLGASPGALLEARFPEALQRAVGWMSRDAVVAAVTI